jgi:ribose transport system substrate-binding protein
MRTQFPRQGTMRGGSRKLVGFITVALVGGSMLAACSSSSSGGGTTAGSTGGGTGGGTTVAAGKNCGTQPYIAPTQVSQTFFKSLPASVQADFSGWPFPLAASPWANSKPVKGPWKIGFIGPPLAGSYELDGLAELKTLFTDFEKQGLVTGSLQIYVQPTQATATPEEQIQAIQSMVAQGVNGIIMETLDGAPLNSAIDAAGKAGVPVVNMDNVVLGNNYGINTFSSQQESFGYAQILKLIGGKGDVINVEGPAGSSEANSINSELLQAVAQCPDVHIVSSLQGDWTDAGAKTLILQYLAAHPTQQLAAVLQNGGTGIGIIQGFLQAGKTVPPISLGGCAGGCVAWWAANKSTYKAAGSLVTGQQAAFTSMNILFRILSGKGLKVNGISPSTTDLTNDNIAEFAVPGTTIDYAGEANAPIDGWGGTNAFLDPYFNSPGVPGVWPTGIPASASSS